MDGAQVQFEVTHDHPYGVQPKGAMWAAMGEYQSARAALAGLSTARATDARAGKRDRQGQSVGAGAPAHSGTGGEESSAGPVVTDAAHADAPSGREAALSRLKHTASIVSARSRGLGPRLASLPDDLLLTVFGCLDGPDLARLAQASRTTYVMAHHADLWRALVLGRHGDRMRFDEAGGCWRQTWLRTVLPGRCASVPPHRPISMPGLYSDVLYKPWACAHLHAPEPWLRTCTIPRVPADELSVERFEREFEEPNRPVIITGLASRWPAMASWSPAELERRFGDRTFVAGGFRMTMRQYVRYAAAVRDDQPLYLFDKRSMDTAPELLDDYDVPPYFAEDRDCLTSLGEHRPARRWLIVGPHLSGSTFHKDPNATCAWNAVAHGRKRWILYPPDQAPPGVHATGDGAEVAAPMALTEWLLDFYAAAAGQRAAEARSKRARTEPGPGYPLEGTVEAGEIMFVPRGWWHTAINLGPTVAVTQNYVPKSGAWAAWRFMTDRPEQVSGVPDAEAPLMAQRFADGVKARMPEVWARVEAEEARVRALAAERSRMSVAGKWLETVRQAEGQGGDAGQLFGSGAAAPSASPFG